MFTKLSGRYKSLFLGNRIFRRLWIGQTLSYFGDAVYDIALLWYVFQATGSASQVALILVASFLPEMLFGIFLGAAADRWNRMRILQIAATTQALAMGALAFCFSFDVFSLWQLYVVTIIQSIAGFLFSVAFGAALPQFRTYGSVVSGRSSGGRDRPLHRRSGAESLCRLRG